MIYLMAPAPKARVSGGFRVNEALRQRLTTTATGVGIHADPEEVPAKIQSLPSTAPAHIVLDSLYLTDLNPDRLNHVLVNRDSPTRLYFLLHFLPCMNPSLSATTRKALQEKEHSLLTLADGILVPGSTLADYLRNESLYTGAIYRCPPGIEFTELDITPSDPWDKAPSPRLITVGTLSFSKGQLDILSHLQQLTPSFKGTWRLLGDLHTEPEVYCHFQRKLNNSGLKESVHLCHSVPHSHLGKLLTDADLLVSASRFESYGMAIAEAVAAGIPVLTYRVGETPQWIKEGENGFLIPVYDHKKFKSTLTKLLHHPEELFLLKKQAQKIKEEIFLPTWEMTFQCFLETFGE